MTGRGLSTTDPLADGGPSATSVSVSQPGRADAAPRRPRSEAFGAFLLLCAVLGFTLVLLIEPLMRPGYSVSQDPISGLGTGAPPLALLFNGALAALGLSTAVFARGLPSGYTVERPTLVALSAALVLAGVFPASYSFHWTFGLLLYLLPAVAIWAFLRSFLRSRHVGLTGLTAGVIVVAAVGLFLTLVGSPSSIGAGGAERLIDFSGLAWGGLVAAGTLRDADLLGRG